MMRDMGLELSFLVPAEKLLEGLGLKLRLVAAIGTPEKADDIDVLHQHEIGGNLRNPAGGKADDDDAPFPGDAAQTLVEGVAADGIVDHVDAASVRERLHALAQIVARVVDQV